jgi:hypothetical protein
MPAIFMQHPEHGSMHVFSEDEAERHEKMGWFRPRPAILPEEPAEPTPPMTMNDEVTVVKRGPGRPRKNP